jgi:hypothetical protein
LNSIICNGIACIIEKDTRKNVGYKEDKIGFINTKGKLIIAIKYDGGIDSVFSEGLVNLTDHN